MAKFNIEEWCSNFNLDKDTRDMLQAQGLDNPLDIVELTEADIKEAGIEKMGQRKALLRGIALLRMEYNPVLTSHPVSEPITTKTLSKDIDITEKLKGMDLTGTADMLFGFRCICSC